jgi:sec-independent protein translocase protein TatA
MPNLGIWEIGLLLLVLLLVFGPKRLPSLGRNVGRGMREFKESVTDHTRELKEAVGETPGELKDALQPLNKDALNPLKSDTPAQGTAASSGTTAKPSG